MYIHLLYVILLKLGICKHLRCHQHNQGNRYHLPKFYCGTFVCFILLCFFCDKDTLHHMSSHIEVHDTELLATDTKLYSRSLKLTHPA